MLTSQVINLGAAVPAVQELDSTMVDGYCRDIIRQGYDRRSEFDSINPIAKSSFLFGSVGVFTVGQLRVATNNDGTSPYDHVGKYRLGRYLDIAAEKQDVSQRGFFSWPLIAEQHIEIDPELDASRDDDIVCLAYDRYGHILGHLGISWLPEDMTSNKETMNPDLRRNKRLLEMEEIYGTGFIRQDPVLMDLTMDQVGILNRFSTVQALPQIPEFVGMTDIVKAKIATHLVASAFLFINAIRQEMGLKMLMFDGERAARRGVELLGGIKMREFNDVPYINIPPLLLPRYTINNREPIKPYTIDVAQLDDPSIVRLQGKLESNNVSTFARILFKDVLSRIAARRINQG